MTVLTTVRSTSNPSVSYEIRRGEPAPRQRCPRCKAECATLVEIPGEKAACEMCLAEAEGAAYTEW